MGETRSRGRGRWALTLCLGALGGCQLIGYEGYPLAAGALDGGSQSDLDAQLDAASFVRATDGGDAATGTTIRNDDGSVPCPPNACGGCATLAVLPDATCGQCGVGRYTCEGPDSLMCSGGDALPKSGDGALILDDFEDGDSVPKQGWVADGYWFAYSDHTAGHLDPKDGTRITPIYEGAAGSARCAHVAGGGFTDFGAGLIMWPNDKQCSFDVSNHRGIGFWVKGNATMRLSVATVHTLDKQYCGSACNDFHGMDYTLTNAWTHYALPWSDLKQIGWGTATTFDPRELLYFQFAFGANVEFELYLDEIGFF